jgi:hypothetical protein
MGKKKKIKRARDAGTGQFVPMEDAKKRPKQVIVDTMPAPKRKKKPR